MYQSTWTPQVNFQTQQEPKASGTHIKIAQNIQDKCQKHEKSPKTKTWQKAKK